MAIVKDSEGKIWDRKELTVQDIEALIAGKQAQIESGTTNISIIEASQVSLQNEIDDLQALL